MKKFSFLCMVFLLLSLMIFSKVRDSAGQVPVIPPDILPVVFLQGSDHEMGLQYGKQAGEYILKVVESYWAEALERFSRKEVMKALKANQYYIRKYAPECITIMRGIAQGMNEDGHPVQYADILLINGTLPPPESSHYPSEAAAETLFSKKCSVCSAWGPATREGKLIGLDTLDSGEAHYGVLIVAFPREGHAYMTGAQAGAIGSHFLMNHRGLFIGNSGGGGSVRERDQDYGISWFCGLPHMIRFCSNAREARKMITDWQIDIPENFHLADTRGNAWVVEKTAALQAVRKSGDFGERDFLFSTNNYLCGKMKVTKKGGFIGEHGGYGAYSAPRNHLFWDMLHNYHGNIDEDFMKMILRFPGNPPPVPPSGGWSAKICRPSNSWVAVAVPDDGDRGYAWLCTGPAGRVIHSSMAFDGTTMRTNYLYPGGTHTFYQMHLAKNPDSSTRLAKGSAADAIATAYEKLMDLKYTDPGYAALERIHDRAVSEYFQGNAWYHRWASRPGNRPLQWLSKAATLYTRAQAHARQVFEALVSPPTAPSDLGLKPFGGDWAEWETQTGKKE